KLPEVAQTITPASYIPEDQHKKLQVLEDLSLLLGPTLTPNTILGAPSDADVLQAIAACQKALQPLGARAGPQSPAMRLVAALDGVAARGTAIIPALREVLLADLPQRLAALAELIRAEPVTLGSLPAELRD